MAFPYRADHVGSLLRPKEILEARANPALTAEQLKEFEKALEREPPPGPGGPRGRGRRGFGPGRPPGR